MRKTDNFGTRDSKGIVLANVRIKRTEWAPVVPDVRNGRNAFWNYKLRASGRMLCSIAEPHKSTCERLKCLPLARER
jgi:hypothetical protein